MSKANFETQIIEASKQVKSFALFLTKDQDKANDLLQDSLLKAFKSKHNFEVGTNAKAWLSAIVRTTFLDTCSRNGRIKKIISFTDSILDFQLQNKSTYNQATTNLELEEIYECMQGVNQDWINPFLLAYEGYKYKEIAEKLNIPLGTVKNRIHKAKEELQYKLKKIGYTNHY